MHKKTKTRSVPLKEKVKHPRPDTMTIFAAPDRRIPVLENALARNRKETDKNHGNRSPTPDVNDSWSWERRGSSDTSISWPEEMEGATTAKVAGQWEAVQRTLYGEDDQVTSEIARAECTQWRDQKPRLRVVGKALSLRGNETEEASTSVLAKPSESSPIVEEIIEEHALAENGDEDSARRKTREARRDEVLKIIVDFVCASVTRKISEDANVFGEHLDEVLKVTPAPTYSARNYSRNGRLTPKVAGGDEKTRLENRGDDEKRNHSGIVVALAGARDGDDVRSTKIVENRVRRIDAVLEKNRSCSRRFSRNVPGTIFSEKIIVGPVPFSTSTKESFSTLKSTPLGLGRLKPTLESSLLQRSTRSVNVGLRGGALERRTDLVRTPHVQSAWQGPVCPTIWPKNIKLAPIDVASLPVGHHRSLAKSVVQPRRARNSLSPIPRDVMPSSLREPSLEIEGKGICGKKIATTAADDPESTLCETSKLRRSEIGNSDLVVNDG